MPTEQTRQNRLGKILYFAGKAHATKYIFTKYIFQTTSHYLSYHSPRFLNSAGVQLKYSRNALVKLETWA